VDKFGVDTYHFSSDDHADKRAYDKKAEDTKLGVCPKCKSELSKHGKVILCPKCGSAPFERNA